LLTIHSPKCEEFGLKLLEVFARGTSYFAYDGSGPVKRDKANATLATFSNGRQYNADLNAAYNIAARGLLLLLKKPEAKTAVIPGVVAEDPVRPGQNSGRSSRIPTVLADVWAFHAQTLAMA
jgi:putative transposase